MPRPPRKQFPGALYHITSRGNGRGQIFFTDVDYSRFMDQLQDRLKDYEVILYAYVLMPNHYHLLIRTPHPNLARFMQRLNTSYALYSRYKHKSPGHRFEGRYKAKLVQDNEYLVTLTRYIHLNPVKVKALQNIGKTERKLALANYPWSSWAGYTNALSEQDFVCYDVLKTLGENLVQARLRYRTYVQAFVMQDDTEFQKILEQSNHAIGGEEYVRTMEQALRDQKSGSSRDRDVAYPEERISCDRINEVVIEAFKTTSEMLSTHGRSKGAGVAKLAAIELACRLSGLTHRSIGAYYGGISSQAVSLARKRAKALIPTEVLVRLACDAKA